MITHGLAPCSAHMYSGSELRSAFFASFIKTLWRLQQQPPKPQNTPAPGSAPPRFSSWTHTAAHLSPVVLSCSPAQQEWLSAAPLCLQTGTARSTSMEEQAQKKKKTTHLCPSPHHPNTDPAQVPQVVEQPGGKKDPQILLLLVAGGRCSETPHLLVPTLPAPLHPPLLPLVTAPGATLELEMGLLLLHGLQVGQQRLIDLTIVPLPPQHTEAQWLSLQLLQHHPGLERRMGEECRGRHEGRTVGRVKSCHPPARCRRSSRSIH